MPILQTLCADTCSRQSGGHSWHKDENKGNLAMACSARQEMYSEVGSPSFAKCFWLFVHPKPFHLFAPCPLSLSLCLVSQLRPQHVLESRQRTQRPDTTPQRSVTLHSIYQTSDAPSHCRTPSASHTSIKVAKGRSDATPVPCCRSSHTVTDTPSIAVTFATATPRAVTTHAGR